MNVRLSNNSFTVKQVGALAQSFNVQLGGGGGRGGSGGGGSDVERLTELQDVNTSNLTSSTNRFVLIYDAGTGGFKFVNPDEVVDAAVGTGTVPGGAPAAQGLSSDTIDYLDEVLDDKIDLDAGSF